MFNKILNAFKKKKVWIPVAVVIVGIIGFSVVWSFHDDPAFCGICHTMDVYVESYEDSPLLAYHHNEAGLICLDCHPFSISQSWHDVVATVTNSFTDPLKELEFTTDQCFECHVDWDTIKELTQIEATVDDAVVIRNPHDSHLGELECSDCHSMHKLSFDYCSQCHDPIVTDDGWETFTVQ